MNMRYLVLFFVLIVSPVRAQERSQCGPAPEVLEGQAYAVEGDMIGFLTPGLPLVRLYGIDAPLLDIRLEYTTGFKSKRHLDEVVSKAAKVTCSFVAWDSSCHAVAKCVLVSEDTSYEANELRRRGQLVPPITVPLSARVVADGMAFVSKKFPVQPSGAELKALVEAEREAYRRQNGLWRDILRTRP